MQPSLTQWTISTFLGWLLGVVFILGLSSLLDALGIENMQFYLGIGMGAGVGLIQWLRLKKFLPISLNWMWFSALGMGVIFIIFDLIAKETFSHKVALSVILGAAAAGFLQAQLLKAHSLKSYTWVLYNCLGWSLGVGTVFLVDYTMKLQSAGHNLFLALLNLVLILAGGVVLGIVSGLGLRQIIK